MFFKWVYSRASISVCHYDNATDMHMDKNTYQNAMYLYFVFVFDSYLIGILFLSRIDKYFNFIYSLLDSI